MNDRNSKSIKAVDVGLLILRAGVGLVFVIHGYPKMFGGPEKWAMVANAAMPVIGIHFALKFWGLLAALSEFFGGIFLTLGLATRLYSFLLTITMIMATASMVASGQAFVMYSHPLKMAFVFLALLFMGPGRISLDVVLRSQIPAKP